MIVDEEHFLVMDKLVGKILPYVVACLLFLMIGVVEVYATESGVEVTNLSVQSDFPKGIRFSVTVESKDLIEEIKLTLRTGEQDTAIYEYFKFSPSNKVESELYWRTSTSSRYIPPGTTIRYQIEISTSSGFIDNRTEEFLYLDSRFDWDSIQDRAITVFYHGPVKSRAEEIMESIIDTLDVMGPILGASIDEPIRVTVYNNVKEMLVALPPGSTTIRRELVTEGQAFSDVSSLLVLGGGRMSTGTASHEVAHILVFRAGGRMVPSWLNEGIAEFANVSPSFSYDIALDYAVNADTLLPITSMSSLPGNPEDVITFYGQASSIVEYMIFRYGAAPIRNLLGYFKEGMNINNTFEKAYGKNKTDLENEWRDFIGAPSYEVADFEEMLPTAIPRTEVKAFTLTPQADTMPVLTRPTTSPEGDTMFGSTGPKSLSENEDSQETFGGVCSGMQTDGVVYGSSLILIIFTFGFSARKFL